jgi:prephenate dehydratase
MSQMSRISEMSLGVIGGPETFAGQSTNRLRELYPSLSEPIYFETGSAMFAALRNNELDAAVGASATLCDGYTVMPRMIVQCDSTLYVVIEELLPFNCSLLGQKGSKLADIDVIYGGSGSLSQARAFFDVHMPHTSTRIYEAPFPTALQIAQGGGKEAILGTRRFAERFSLEILAENIDGGTLNGSWWVISRLPLFEPQPTILFVAGRFSDDCQLGRLVTSVGARGFEISGVTSYASGGRLMEFDYLLRFRGAGELASVQAALANFRGTRLAGAIASPCAE